MCCPNRLRKVQTPGVLIKLREHQYQIATAAPVWHELQYGYHRLPPSQKRNIIESFLFEVIQKNVTILPYDDRAAIWHAKQRAELSLHGITPPSADAQIASIAAVNELVLITRNVKDFIHFKGLRIENWHEKQSELSTDFHADPQ